jgi:hypothetical protein
MLDLRCESKIAHHDAFRAAERPVSTYHGDKHNCAVRTPAK